MKHLDSEIFRDKMEKMQYFGINSGKVLYHVFKDLIYQLIKEGFKIKEIVTILNFILYEYGFKFKVKYYHLYYFLKRDNLINTKK